MLKTDYVRNLNCNYERILLEEIPEENRYQYCIVTRGGIKGLLSCSLRYINDQAFLYYDISSTQSLAQLFAKKSMGRKTVRELLWWMRRMRQELGRFLLEDKNMLWHPEHVFMDLEKEDFFFVYVPYLEAENGMENMFDFLAEHIDYEDDLLVETVYKLHERYKELGEVYLEEKIYEDCEVLEGEFEENRGEAGREELAERSVTADANVAAMEMEAVASAFEEEKENRRGIRYFFDGRKRRQKEEREEEEGFWKRTMPVYAVSEEAVYRDGRKTAAEGGAVEGLAEGMAEEYGRTVYIEEIPAEKKAEGLYGEDGKVICVLDKQTVILGKKKEEADCVVDHGSVSRMHARITREKDCFYLEDLNSTNGTWKNGIRLQPYEKRKIEKEDEIRLGKVVLFYR